MRQSQSTFVVVNTAPALFKIRFLTEVAVLYDLNLAVINRERCVQQVYRPGYFCWVHAASGGVQGKDFFVPEHASSGTRGRIAVTPLYGIICAYEVWAYVSIFTARERRYALLTKRLP